MLFRTESIQRKIVYSYLALILANLIWGATGPVIKYTVSHIPPFTFLFLRFLLVCILLLPYTVVESSKVKVDKSDYWKIVVLGLLSQASIILIFLGLTYTTAVDAAIIGTTGVLLSMTAGHYFFNEKFHPGVKIGLVLALVGTLVVVLEPILTGAHATQNSIFQRVYGNALILLYNILFLIYVLWSKISMGHKTKVIKKTLDSVHIKPMKHRYPAALMTATSFYVGLLSMIPFALLENTGKLCSLTFDITSIDVKAVYGLVYMTLFSSILAYFMFEWALDKVGVSDSAVLGYLSSIFGIPVAYLLLGEIPSKFGVVGALVIFIGIAIAEMSNHVVKRRKWFLK